MRYLYFLFGAYVSVVSCLTLYVDKSCTAHGAPLDNALEEAFLMARGAKDRLLSTTDTDFERVMERIFNFKRTDEKSLQKVIDVMSCIGSLKFDNNRIKADVRLYCDNDLLKADGNNGRWEPRPNKLKGFVDNLNHIVTDEEGLGCQLEGVLGATYGTPSKKETKRQPDGRSTISLCDYVFTKPVLFMDAAGKKLEKLEKGSIDVLKNTLSFTILHELTHIPSCSAEDQKIGTKKGTLAYGWTKCIGLPPNKAILNSDSYAFLGTFAWLAKPLLTMPDVPPATESGEPADPLHSNAPADFKIEGGWSLPRPEQADYEQQAKDGWLYRYKDITKRALESGVETVKSMSCAVWSSAGKHCLEFRG